MYNGAYQNSEYISETPAHYALLQTSLGTGPGEAALDDVSQLPQAVMVRQNPVPSRISYIQPQFQYRQSPQYVQERDTSKNPLIIKNVAVKDGSEARTRVIKELLLITIGVIICALPLAAVCTLYVQLKASQSTTTTTTTAGTTSVSLPSQCSNYTLDTDITRLTNYTVVTAGCDQTLYSSSIWVRFGGSATRMATSAPSTYRCATYATGWFTGTLPSTAGSTIAGVVCFTWTSSICDFHSQISVTNCNSFYVYLMVSPSTCALRYCTE